MHKFTFQSKQLFEKWLQNKHLKKYNMHLSFVLWAVEAKVSEILRTFLLKSIIMHNHDIEMREKVLLFQEY